MTNPFDDDPWASEATAIDGDDPFGDEDPFDNQRDGFAKVEWLIQPERLVLMWPLEIKHLQGDNGPFDAIECRLVVLDGPTNENIPTIPYEILPFRFNSESIVNDLKHLIGSRKPKLARVHSQPSKRNKLVPARFLTAPTEEDRTLARKYMATQLHQ